MSISLNKSFRNRLQINSHQYTAASFKVWKLVRSRQYETANGWKL